MDSPEGRPPSRSAWVPLAEVTKPHGVRGEVHLKLFNQDSDVLLDQDEVLVRLADGAEHEVSVDGARRAAGAILMKLYSVDDRDRADELRGALVCVRRDAFPPLDEGEFYVCDVEGARAMLRLGEELTPLGRVRELRSYPSVEVLVISAADGGKDWEIPLVEAFVERVDAERGEVIVASLAGLDRG
jgi:16S rRNA processing protein RimM